MPCNYAGHVQERKARLSDRASDGIDAVLDRQGITFTAMIEAVGVMMADGHWTDDSPQAARVFELARQIQRERLRRSR